jgi:hypothetical protein
VQPFQEPSRERGGQAAGPAVRILYPRGMLRPADLNAYRVESDLESVASGAVEFRRGGKVVHREDLKVPAGGEVVRQVPAGIRAMLRTGDKITWGFYPSSGEPVTTTFEVVQRDLDAALGGISAGAKGQPAAAQSHLRAQVFLDAGLSHAAYQEALQVVEKGSTSPRAWAVMLEALDAMGASRESHAWREAQSRMGAFSAAQRDEVYPPSGHAFQKVLGHVRSGNVGRALVSMDKLTQEELARDPAQVRELASALAAGARASLDAAPGSAKKLADALLETARQALEKSPDSASVQRAIAEARLARARLELHLGENPPAGRWVEAAETVLRAAETEAERGAAHHRAVQILLEAATVPGADTKAILAEAQRVAEESRAKFPEEPQSAATLAEVRIARARALPKKQRNEAAVIVKEALEDLKPTLAGPNPAPETATQHAALVSLVRERNLPVNGLEYLTVDHVSDQNLLRLIVPLSLRWRVADDLRGRELIVVRQLGPEGQLDRLITAREFRWGVPYNFVARGGSDWRAGGAGEISGDNASGLAESDFNDAERAFSKVERTEKPRVKAFSKHFDRGYAYLLEGRDASGAFLRVRSWLFRSQEFKLHYQVTVRDLRADVPENEEELTFVLESLRDTGAK